MKYYIAVLALLSTVCLISADEICCRGGECYDDHPPFHGMPLPECAERLSIHLTLYNRLNDRRGEEITRNTIPAIFNKRKMTIFYTHGWLGSDRNNWLDDMKDDTLAKDDYNVIIVGWQKGAQQIWYPQSASDTRSVGKEIALVAENLVVSGGLDRSLTYCVGHSLGSHVCGHAGNYFKFGRITGLDPAGPLFENKDLACGLNPNSADLVDVIHTNGEPSIVLNLGTMRVLGHVDFYPNGGAKQPECILDPFKIDGLDQSLIAPSDSRKAGDLSRILEESARRVDLMPACSHMRAIYLYLESILSPCFTSNQRCTDQYTLPRSCATAPNTIQTMGFESNLFPESGIFYLETNGKSPYCLRANLG